jgi:hypothetical protein
VPQKVKFEKVTNCYLFMLRSPKKDYQGFGAVTLMIFGGLTFLILNKKIGNVFRTLPLWKLISLKLRILNLKQIDL